MAKIKIDIEGLRQNASKIERQIQTLQDLNSRLDRLISDIEATWTGVASEKYVSIMRIHKQKAELMVNVLTEFKRYINQASTTFERHDQEGANRIYNSGRFSSGRGDGGGFSVGGGNGGGGGSCGGR